MFPLNLPNALTVVRILLVPVLVVALTVEAEGGSAIAAAVFVVAALTDGLDGYIARSRKSVTTFGKVMDPVADKLLIAAALISLVSLDRLAPWVAMAIIAAPDHEAGWVEALVYSMVAVTVLSGADYFLNFRRRLEQISRTRPRPE